VSGRPAPSSEASSPRVLVVDSDGEHELFEVVAAVGDVIRVRSAFLFELGEELGVRIVHEGRVSEATARVRAHTGPDEARITELEISDRSAPRAGGAG
jgi:hypothetical protein